MKKLTIVLLGALLLFALVSCAQPTAEGQADDIVFTPGGLVYRANHHQEGVKNPWPSIESTEVVLGDSLDVVQVSYRDRIETQAGQIRNNIFYIYLPNVDVNDANFVKPMVVSLKAINLPARINVSEGESWHGPDPGRRSELSLKIEVSPQVQPGEYSFEVSVEINGKDYGRVPCTIKAVE
jgi:hypothetical protein